MLMGKRKIGNLWEVIDLKQKETFLCIDLKSFYASVECVERGLDPFTTNLVVADPDRSVSTICLAITPAMKKLGISQCIEQYHRQQFQSYQCCSLLDHLLHLRPVRQDFRRYILA